MKKLKFIFVFTLVAAFVSCGSDDDNGNGNNLYSKENLLGIHQLKSYQSKEIREIKLEGGLDPVTIETTSIGDNYGLSYEFAANDEVTLDGNFLIKKTIKQGNQKKDTTIIVNYNSEDFPYSVNKDEKTLTIDGKAYKVENYKESGFELSLEESSNSNGIKIQYTENLRFSRD